jgi:Arc/MetJ-type ribon-helix-helix transcriptional regulator
MTTRNVSLTRMLDAYVEERVRSGAFQDASHVVRDQLVAEVNETADSSTK